MTASRGASSSVKRSPAASSSFAPSPRIASVIRTPSKREPGQGERGRVELAELEVGEVGAGGRGEHRAGADRAARVGGAAPQRRRAAGREHGRRRGDRAGVGDHPVAALAVAPQRRRRGPLPHLDPLLGGDHRRQLRGHLVAGLAAAGVDDAPARVAALEPQRQPSLRGRGRRRRRAPAGRGPRRAPPRPAPARRRGGRGRGRRRSCRRRGARASRRARAPRRARPGPRSWRSGRAACGRPGRRCRPARPPAAPSRGRRRRRRRRRRRTRRLAAIASQPLGGSSRAARAARRRRLRGPAPARRRPRARPRSARRSAALDPLLGRLGLGFDLAEALLGGGDRLLLGLALALQLFLVGEPQLLAGLLGAGALALEVGLQRLDLGGRRGARPSVATSRRRLQPALGLLDLGAEALAAGAAGFGAHRRLNLLPGCR